MTRGGFALSWESVENPNGAAASGPLESAAGFHDHMEVRNKKQFRAGLGKFCKKLESGSEISKIDF